MSDKEEVRGHEESSGDESSSEATKNGFSHDGEPVNRPRKDSSSSSASSDSESESEAAKPAKMADSDDEDDSVSKSISKTSVSKSEDISEASKSEAASSGAEQPPQPKSRSVSVEEAVSPPAPAERKVSVASDKSASEKSASVPKVDADDTDDDVEDEEIEEAKFEATQAPVPLERKVSAPAEPAATSPVAVEEKEEDVKEVVELKPELTEAEVELSKRETVHLEEVANDKVEAEMTTSRKSSTASSSVHEKAEVVMEDEPQEVAAAPAAEMTTSRKSSSASSADSVSSEDVDEPVEEVQEAKPATIIEEEPMVEAVTNGRSAHSNGQPQIAPEADSSSSSESEEVTKPKLTSHDDKELNGKRSGTGDVTKKYQQALNNNNNSVTNNNNIEKGERTKPTRDITQIYTQTLSKTNTPPASPKMAPRSRPANDITKLYTGGLETRSKSPAAIEKLSPKKHNMSTAVDKDAIRRAYDDVRSDSSETEWAVFKFDQSNRLGVTGTGKDFADFKQHFGNDDRGFGYIRIKTGDEMSKRAKFVLVTWVGPNVSVMKKAKMSTDKALMKDVIQNMSVELQLENHGEFSHDHFKMQVDKASGARYGTGVRAES